MADYGLRFWGEDNFFIDEGKVKVNYKNSPALVDIVKELRNGGYRGPVILRFPHLIKKQIDMLFDSFKHAMKEYDYNGSFRAVFPLKVNQFPNYVLPLVDVSSEYDYGLEAGSKAELIIAMAYNNNGAPITVNGFKDKEMISLGFIAAKMGHDITITIEGLNELETIIEVAKTMGKPYPKIGIRIRLHSSGIGYWAKSGGINSKFGLTATELVEAVETLQEVDMIGSFTMIHFHIGSQMNEITPLKKALREAGNIYTELKKMGAKELKNINLGGGLAVEYSQHEATLNRNYTLQEFSNDVVFLIKEIVKAKQVEEPDIFVESGRFIAATHAVLVAPVLELFSQEYDNEALKLKEKNPRIVEELYELYEGITKKNAIEYLHDSLDHLESILTLFDLGYVDLQDRSNTEVLVHLIIKKAAKLLKNSHSKDIMRLQRRVQERYLVNFSMFQSLPDYWGLRQHFPVMPLDRLDESPTRSASLWDITCDSDGEIEFNPDMPLFLHDIDVKQEEYFLAFFLTGAYQEILGMRHNLFSHPTEVTVNFDDQGRYVLEDMLEAQSVLDVLDDIDYDVKEVERRLKQRIDDSVYIEEDKKKDILSELYLYLSENGYLRTIINND